MEGGWVYVMTDEPGGVLYIGAAADLVSSVARHRERAGSRDNLRRLVLVEPYPTIEEAFVREKAMKKWRRALKIELIERSNPGWHDLWDFING